LLTKQHDPTICFASHEVARRQIDPRKRQSQQKEKGSVHDVSKANTSARAEHTSKMEKQTLLKPDELWKGARQGA